MTPRFDVVIPTVGRPTLRALLERLASCQGPLPERIVVVLDRSEPPAVLPAPIAPRVRVVRGRDAGPAAARNVGRQVGQAAWIAFLDDDVLPELDWLERLSSDLADLGPEVAGSQGRVSVPLPPGRTPTDWERNVKGLETARFTTADMAYRRSVLEQVGGFDERFPRAFREDADLALRILGAGYAIVQGTRRSLHPVRPARSWASVALQAGNRDDVLMRALHGPEWRERAQAPRGRLPVHLALTAVGAVGLACALTGKRRPAALAGLAWLGGTAELAWRRIAPGPRTPREIAAMIATSAVLPAAATYHWLAGWAQLPGLLRSRPRAKPAPKAILLDRDGTLVADVPYNGDPGRVVPMPGAREALDRLRARGLPLGVISNQSGVARGLITHEQVDAVNVRVEELVGPVDAWLYCPHLPDEGCECRKPSPGMVIRAATQLGVDAADCAVVGDIGSDVEAARAAGARVVLVPTARTRREEIASAPEVARSLSEAVDLLLGGVR